jgi:hypothetical protein
MQPQFPVQGRMGPRMMGQQFGAPRNPMMFGANRPPQFPAAGMNRAPQFPMGSMMGGSQQMNRGGGLLSRLMGRGAQPSGLNGLMGMQQTGRAAAGGGSLMQSLSNPSGLSTFLNNTQQVIQTAQSLGPMIQQFQQYGSLIRNIPAMWKIFQGLKNSPDSSETESASSDQTKSKQSSKTSSNKSDKGSSSEKKATGKQKQKRRATRNSESSEKIKGSSVPKLYI